MGEKAEEYFFTTLIIQIVSFVFLSVLDIGIKSNITFDFPLLTDISIVNFFVTSWNILKFLFQVVFFSFLTYNSWILVMINLFFNTIIWVSLLFIVVDSIEKIKPFG